MILTFYQMNTEKKHEYELTAIEYVFFLLVGLGLFVWSIKTLQDLRFIIPTKRGDTAVFEGYSYWFMFAAFQVVSWNMLSYIINSGTKGKFHLIICSFQKWMKYIGICAFTLAIIIGLLEYL